jgi:hypothetical protein
MLLLVVVATIVLVVISAVSVGPVASSIGIEVGATASSLLGSVTLFHVDEILFLGMVHDFIWHSHVFDVHALDIDFWKFQEFLTVGGRLDDIFQRQIHPRITIQKKAI